MSKGKEHKKYEFGAKALLVVGKNNGVILGAYSLPKNDYDGHALEPTLVFLRLFQQSKIGHENVGLYACPFRREGFSGPTN